MRITALSTARPSSYSGLFLFVLICGLLPTVKGQISVSGDVSSGTGQLTLSQDLSFTITQTGTANFLVFDDWVSTSDGSQTLSSMDALANYNVDGGGNQTTIFRDLVDNLTFGLGAMNATDTYVVFDTFSVTSGTTVTFTSTFWNLGTVANFNSEVSGSFGGTYYLTDGSGNILGTASAVPEPSTYAAIFGAVALAGVMWFRRRKGRG